MKKKKLLFIIHSSAPSGGAEDDIENLLIKLSKNSEYEIDGLLPDGPRRNSFKRFFKREGKLNWGVFPVINSGILKYLKYFLKMPIQVFQIRKFVKNENYDICLISVAVLIWPLLYLKHKKFKNIIFIKETIEPEFIRNIIYRLIKNNTDYSIPNSKIIENEFIKVTGSRKVKTVYSSVSDTGYDPNNQRKYEKHLGPALINKFKKPLRLLVISNLVKIKNPLAAIQAVELISKDAQQNVNLFIIGKEDVEHNYSIKIKNYVYNSNLENIVNFLGYQKKDIIEYVLKNVDFLVIPSFSEGIPLVLVYALKFKVPVITTDAGGISDIIKNEYNGIITKPEAVSIYNSIKKLYENEELQNNIKINGYSTFTEKFNLNKNIDEIISIINNIDY